MPLTFATTHTGGDGFGIGAKAAGLKPSWGVEIRPDIAAWAERNDPDLSIIVAAVQTVYYAALPTPWWLHSSPVCKNASVAKVDGGEDYSDIMQAIGICRAIEQLLPPVFSLENVWAYRQFHSFQMILRTLNENGYNFNYWYLNAADYGVPQSRKRLILVASRTRRVPDEIPQTHYKLDRIKALNGMRSMFWKPWNGWYEAIEDLIADLPDSEFAPWQLARLPDEIKKNFLLGQGERSKFKGQTSPADTVTSNSNQTGVKAFVVNSQTSDNGQGVGVRKCDETMVNIVSSHHSVQPRAFIVGGQYQTPNNGTDRQVQNRSGDSPNWTITATEHGDTRAFIVDGQNARLGGPTSRWSTQPIFTVTNAGKAVPRAYFGGRVVSMTPRALARFQTVPDEYELPYTNRLACEIVGNMVPPLLAQRIIDAVQEAA